MRAKGADGGLRKEFRKHLPAPFEWTSIETGIVTQGVPDSYYSHREERTHGWIEFKKTMGWTVPLEPHQVGWLWRHSQCGVRTTVGVRQLGVGRDGVERDALWLLCGSYAREAAAGGLRSLPSQAVLGKFDGGPRMWPWGAVAKIILRPL